jgi:hypothetical protein
MTRPPPRRLLEITGSVECMNCSSGLSYDDLSATTWFSSLAGRRNRSPSESHSGSFEC